MKKYVSNKKLIGLSLGLLALVVFCIFKQPSFAILIAIITITAVLLPNSKILDWVKVALLTLSIGMTIYAILQIEFIHGPIAKAFPGATWIFTICGTIIVGNCMVICTWRRMRYWDESAKEKSEVREKVIDLTYHTKDEPEKVEVYSDEKSGKILVLFGNCRWFLKRGIDKLEEETEESYVILRADGSKMILPKAQSIKAAL